MELTFAQLINKEIEYTENVEKELTNLINRSDYNYHEVFKAIDTKHIGIIDFDSLSTYLKKKHSQATPDDIRAFIRRADKDLDCKISYEEFVSTFSLSKAKEKITRPRCITPNKKAKVASSRPRSITKSKSFINKLDEASPPVIKVSLTPFKNKTEANKKAILMTEGKKKNNFIQSSKNGKTLTKLPLSAKRVNRTRSTKRSPVYAFIEQQLESERRIELMKQSLSLHDDYTIQRLWSIFDPKGKGSVSAMELFNTLKALGLNPDKESTYLLFNRFALNFEPLWRYENIELLGMPSEKV